MKLTMDLGNSVNYGHVKLFVEIVGSFLTLTSPVLEWFWAVTCRVYALYRVY